MIRTKMLKNSFLLIGLFFCSGPLLAQSNLIHPKADLLKSKIQRAAKTHSLRQSGTFNPFQLAESEGLVEVNNPEQHWTAEADAGAEALFTTVEGKKLSYLSAPVDLKELSRTFCAPEAVIVKGNSGSQTEDREVKKGKEVLCLEIGVRSSLGVKPISDTAKEYKDYRAKILPNFIAVLSLNKTDELNVELTSGGQFIQQVYVWPFSKLNPSSPVKRRQQFNQMNPLKDDDQPVDWTNRQKKEYEFVYGLPVVELNEGSVNANEIVSDLARVTSSGLGIDFSSVGRLDETTKNRMLNELSNEARPDGRQFLSLAENYALAFNELEKIEKEEKLEITNDMSKLYRSCQKEKQDNLLYGQNYVSEVCAKNEKDVDETRERKPKSPRWEALITEGKAIQKSILSIARNRLKNLETDPSFLKFVIELRSIN